MNEEAGAEMKYHGDWMPEDMRCFRTIEEIFRSACLCHGYGEVRTPVIEKLHWFTGAGVLSPDLMHKVYTFLDWDGWSGERVVLRPDNTVPVCRLFSEYYKEKQHARLFYIEDVFRYEDEQTTGGQHCQMGVELLGNVANPTVRDVEILLLLFHFLKDLKIGTGRIVLSHAGILRAYLKTLNLSASEEEAAFDLLLEGRTLELQKICADRCQLEGLNRLLELRGSSAAFLTNLKSLGKSSGEFTQAAMELEQIAFLLEALGYKFEIFPGIHKDLTYYTGVMFDVYVDDVKIGGGGRYDHLLEKFTKERIGGSGFSVYAEPLMDLMKKKGAVPPETAAISLIANLDKKDEALEALRLACKLRRCGVAVEILSHKERRNAGELSVEVKKTRKGYEMIAKTGRRKKSFSLPLKGVKELLIFWGGSD